LERKDRSKEQPQNAVPVFLDLDNEMSFERILTKAVNEGLTSISNIVAPVLRIYLDDAVTTEIGCMKSESTLKDIKALEKGLERIFGFGAKVFERKILMNLYAMLSLNFDPEQSLSFLGAVKKARKIYESRKHTNKKPRDRGHMSLLKPSHARKS
jgi:hypothetical protein